MRKHSREFAKLFIASFAIFTLLPAISFASVQNPTFISASRSTYNCPPGTVCSTNWSGYAVTGPSGSVTDVKGSWTVPAVTCSSKTTYSSYWVGIDGYNSNTVEQTGTDSDCSSGHAVYYAWYEFYPAASVKISGFTVKPGDQVYAEVSYSSTGQFTVTVTDGSQTHAASASVSGAARSSAEWIVERPALCIGAHCKLTSLSRFGTVYLGADYTSIAGTNYATVSGATGAIGSFGSDVARITMVNSAGSTLAEPSVLSADGTSFSETWFASS